MQLNENIRWKQRFNNFSKAYKLLNSVFEERKIEELSILEQEGVIQRFEYTYELAWKTLKDYLEYNGNLNNIDITARNVFKEAYSAGIIKEQGIFIDMMLSRNLLSHTYDFARFKEIIIKIENDYLNVLEDLNNFFVNKL
ncbi:nucleotidyltransferase substrate binding protein [Brachyspira hampsonii]|uniref:Nucleotidyltransferase n=1 Tax=Brachyspira hampsonii TaxID=1287055 RepID=A0AAC9XJD0_9SPIR|nr:nucleotidyltransferase substrate binding protein [Brachyspira hampsonii]ASJ20261.1 nucleotidyltransferase [Brachyspira hampsonii]ELV07047.1 putative nucleotidyltransferase substrate-binding protein [Brachyspira hampsonii 30599]MBW5379223.1 nucleotidyltransferase [Brachyspira hampsonii]MBW5410051.1 nucleotidyltransferase [Brachyspira hampsonii]OEJ16414.1 nucleotidyltransferase [Brachyspira hampsonii]